MDDRWFVWIAGSPHTQHHTYLALHDSGKVERITEGPDVYVVADMTGA